MTDHWRCRFLPAAVAGGPAARITLSEALAVPVMLAGGGIEVVGTEVLQRVDGAEAYSSGASG
jgi:hypothetical protein